MAKRFSHSTKKFIRSEKARIRRQFLDYKTQTQAIANMYNKVLNKPTLLNIEKPERTEVSKNPLPKKASKTPAKKQKVKSQRGKGMKNRKKKK